MDDILKKFMKAVKDHVMDGLDLELAEILVNALNEILSILIKKQSEQVDPSWIIRPHLKDMMLMILKSLAVFQSFMLQGKPDPDHVKEAKKLILQLFDKLTELSEDPSQPFLDANIAQVIADSFVHKNSDQLSSVSLQSPTWRLFHALFDFMTAEHLQLELPEPESIFTQQARKRTQQQSELKQVTFEEIKEAEEEPCTIEEVA